MVYCKSSETQKEIKKPGGKPLRVWAQNQLRFEIFEKNFENFIRKFRLDIIFGQFVDFPGILSFYTAMENKTIFLQHFLGFAVGGALGTFSFAMPLA